MYLSTTREAAWCILMVVSVCMSVCLSDDNFRKPCRTKFIFAHAAYLHALRVTFVRSSGQGQDQGHRSQKGRKFLFPQCNTSIGNNSRSVRHTAWCLRAARGFGWRIEFCNRHLCHVTTDLKWIRITKCIYSRMVLRMRYCFELHSLNFTNAVRVTWAAYVKAQHALFCDWTTNQYDNVLRHVTCRHVQVDQYHSARLALLRHCHYRYRHWSNAVRRNGWQGSCVSLSRRH